MALFKISKGLAKDLPMTTTEGFCYLTTDDHMFYVDLKSSDGVTLTTDEMYNETNPYRIRLNAEYAVRALKDQSGNTINSVFYGECTTAQATKAKIATLTDAAHFVLNKGTIIVIKFTNAAAASTMTLNVNDTGAKALYQYGTTVMNSSTTTTGWPAGAVVPFVYDGNNWFRLFWANTTYSSMTVEEGNLASATTGRLITAKNLKQIIDNHSINLIKQLSFTPVTDTVLGADSTFTVTDPTITVTPTTTNIKATATGTAVTVNTSSAVTGFGTNTTDTFIKSYPGSSSKLVTTSIKGVSGTETVSAISSNDSITATKIDSYGTAASLTSTYTADSETLTLSWTANTVPSGSDVTATNTVYSSKTVATANSNATTVATGSVDTTGTGGSVLIGLGTATTASAITTLGTPTTSSFATSIKSVTQPTIALATNATAGTGVISVATGITSASASGTAVSADGDTVTVLTDASTFNQLS